MFDKVELKLRLCGSKTVVKYPRCSLRRQSTYADAEEDPSQVLALASVWILLLAFGISAFIVPIFYTYSRAIEDTVNSRYFFSSGRFSFELLPVVNDILLDGFGSLIGYPVASASVQALRGLWRNDLVALKASCPNCGEEVFAFVRAEKPNLLSHGSECHVCECVLWSSALRWRNPFHGLADTELMVEFIWLKNPMARAGGGRSLELQRSCNVPGM